MSSQSLSDVKIKICGLTRLTDAQLAVEQGAWAVGFILYRKSPRAVTSEQVSQIVSHLPALVKKVGVFVNPTLSEITLAIATAGLNMVQLSGDEDPALCAKVKAQTQVRVVKALTKQTAFRVSQYPEVDFFLFDSKTDQMHGGTGILADSVEAKKLSSQVPLWLAGGLNSSNVAASIELVQPFLVDVSSGVESSPGRKDQKKMLEFFKAVKLASQNRRSQ